MYTVLDNGRVIVYRVNMEGNFYDISLDKLTREVKVIMYSNVLSNADSQNIVNNIIRNAKDIPLVKEARKVGVEFQARDFREVDTSRKIMSNLGLNGNVLIVGRSNTRKKNIEENFLANMIVKNDSGKTVSYVERLADNNSKNYLLENVSLNDMKRELDLLWLDSNVDIEHLSDKEIAGIVLDRISERQKKYTLESAREYSAKDKQEEATLNVTRDDDKVNPEIGVVKKDPMERDFNSYRTVEREGEHYNMVNPSVNEVSSINNESNEEENDLIVSETEARDMEKIYYLDNNSGDIYNEIGEVVGNIRDGYQVNYENNHLMKDGKDLGVIDDYNSLGKSDDLSKPKVRVLEKPMEDETGKISIWGLIGIIVIVIILVLIVIFSI